jgi:hypothetical protein
MYWHPQGSPHTSHSSARYWANVADVVDFSNVGPPNTVNRRRGQPDPSMFQLPTQPPAQASIVMDTTDAEFPN